MQLTVPEAASYLGVDDATVRRWIRTRGLPAHQASERLHLNALEVWQWATERGVPVSRRLLDRARRAPDPVPPLGALLEAGGVHHDLAGRDKAAVLREMVARLPLPNDVDRDFLLSVLEAREAMGSTGIGDGIAIPHVRNPILLRIQAPLVALCLLRHPVEFGAIDGKKVHALFSVISPTVPAHLRILAQLGYVLRDAELRRLLAERRPAAEIVSRVRELDARASGAFAPPAAT
ncbi:MAG TPA: PTS sugar transporter subunit IIA [Gemmatimonadales bacterium]|nr:PTS sugar transporter subunit IIA [Gemmatimonadales bacterium]